MGVLSMTLLAPSASVDPTHAACVVCLAVCGVPPRGEEDIDCASQECELREIFAENQPLSSCEL